MRHRRMIRPPTTQPGNGIGLPCRVDWRPWGILACVTVLALAGCSGQASEGQPGAADLPKKPAAPQFDRSYPVVLIHSNAGDITVKLDAVQAPGTVHNFLSYVSEGFYSGTTFHYVESGAMILGGGYTAQGEPKQPRLPIRNEAHNGLKNLRGTIVMARDPAAIDSAASQFFINLVDAPGWDHKGDSPDQYGYCVFGEVIEGLDVADKISKMSTKNLGGDLSSVPQPPVVIESIKVIR